MAVRIHSRFMVMALVAVGCQQSATQPSSEEAEVPQPGPAVVDPGPAPDGQWEPPTGSDTSEQGSSVRPADEATHQTGPAGQTDDAVNSSTETGQDAAPVTVKLQSWDATETLIASHKGKVVVVDFWSTSCLPCRREFPHLVALQNTYPKKVACVSVSLDYSGRKSRPPETYRDSVLEFLREQQASFDNVLSTDDPDELEQRLELAPIPLVWVFDTAGERRRTFDNGDLDGDEFTYQKDVVPFVEALLTES